MVRLKISISRSADGEYREIPGVVSIPEIPDGGFLTVRDDEAEEFLNLWDIVMRCGVSGRGYFKVECVRNGDVLCHVYFSAKMDAPIFTFACGALEEVNARIFDVEMGA